MSPPLGESSSRSTSPVRPKGLSILSHQQLTPSPPLSQQPLQSSRQNVSSGKKSESLIGRGRRRSPVPTRKGQTEVVVASPSGAVVPGTSGGNVSGSQSHSRPVPHSGSQDEPAAPALCVSVEDNELPSLDSTANLSNGSSMEFLGGQGQEDFVDGVSGTPDLQRTRVAIDRLHQKVDHTKEMIGEEQRARDENVNEYLKLASNADKLQLQRIKNVFEKKNQKSAQTISQLQKKLENYNRRIKELETYGVSSHHRQPKEVLRDVGQGLKDVGANIRDGITGFSGGVVGNIKGGLSGLSQATHSAAESVMSKPREYVANLIKYKFGSADNISTMTTTKAEDESNVLEDGTDKEHHHNSATFAHSTKFPSDDECSSVTSGSGPTAGTGTMSSPRNQPSTAAVATVVTTVSGGVTTAAVSSLGMTPPMVPQADVPFNFEPLLQELQEKREECQHLHDDVDSLKAQINQDIAYFNSTLLEERYRYERLEEQMNDLIELHQNEIENLKQNISDMEEKLQYQSEERLRDIYEMMESCQTRISRIEHQQHEQQQLVTLEGIENTNARALVLKLINVLLTVLQVVLLLVATATNILMPFLKTRVRILTTTFTVLIVLITVRQWHDLMAYLQDLKHHYTSGT